MSSKRNVSATSLSGISQHVVAELADKMIQWMRRMCTPAFVVCFFCSEQLHLDNTCQCGSRIARKCKCVIT